MATEKLVVEVNTDLRALLEECETQKENHRLIRLVKNIVRLTDDEKHSALDDMRFSTPNAGGHTEVSEAEIDLINSTTEHKHVADIYGNCSVCKECLHQKVGVNGICVGCGSQVADAE